jgi:hypothetical protein
MSEFDETHAGRVPVEGGGAWAPAANETPDDGPSWPALPAARAGSETQP